MQFSIPLDVNVMIVLPPDVVRVPPVQPLSLAAGIPGHGKGNPTCAWAKELGEAPTIAAKANKNVRNLRTVGPMVFGAR